MTRQYILTTYQNRIANLRNDLTTLEGLDTTLMHPKAARLIENSIKQVGQQVIELEDELSAIAAADVIIHVGLPMEDEYIAKSNRQAIAAAETCHDQTGISLAILSRATWLVHVVDDLGSRSWARK